MHVPSIKALVENNDLVTLEIMQQKLENGEQLDREVGGADDGEKLTHLLAAIDIKKAMFKNGTDLKTELRNFTGRVRDSISGE
jgi:hypothetical protein